MATILGTIGNDSLLGTDGSDEIQGLEGNDTLDGGIGADTMIGGVGDDTYFIDDVGDKVKDVIDQGIDTVIVSSTIDFADIEFLTDFFNFLENMVFGGTVGLGNNAANTLTGNDLDNLIDGRPGDDTLFGGSGNDTLRGGNGPENNSLVGGDGNDVLEGFGLKDTMEGGAGNDLYFVNTGGNPIIIELAGQGIDQISTNIKNFSLNTSPLANIENLYIDGGKGGGNALDNLIYSSGGDDTLSGLGGNDTLDGGDGADSMIGGTGDDTYVIVNVGDIVTELAGEGTDTAIVGSNIGEADMKFLDNIENMVFGGTVGRGNALNNKITGTDLDNLIEGRGGFDTLIGGNGNDTYIVESTADLVVELAGEGTDQIFTALLNYRLDGAHLANVEDLNFAVNGGDGAAFGNSLNNFIRANAGKGNTGANKLYGLDGDYTLDGGGGNDLMVGGSGNDDYVVDSAKDRIVELAGKYTGFDEVVSNVESYVLSANIEKLELGAGAKNGTGNAQANYIFGNGVDNKLIGGGGNDTLDGKSGADSMAGGTGNDIYYVDSLIDSVTEGAGQGIDLIRINQSFSLNTKALANVENLYFDAGTGVGNSLSNLIFSGGGDDTLIGLGGNDTLDGGGGADSMRGGVGNDTYYIDNVGDIVTELAGEGIDTVIIDKSIGFADMQFLGNIENMVFGGAIGLGNGLNNKITGSDSAQEIDGRTGNDTLNGGSGDDKLSGGDGNDSLIGGLGHDILNGGAGIDIMAGGDGYDVFHVDNVKDRVIELAGAGSGNDTVIVTGIANYVLSANVEHLQLGNGALNGAGNGLDNFIGGNGSNNKLSGGGGNDEIAAGAGADTMTGGAGRDRFVLSFVDGVDRVTDFNGRALGDTLDLSDLLSGFTAASDPNAFVRFNASGGSTTVQVDFDGAANGANFINVCILQGATLTSVTQALANGNLLLTD